MCGSSEGEILRPKNDRRHYFSCSKCKLIHVPPSLYVSPSQEQLRYEEHNNRLSESSYLDFLNRVVKPALPYLNSDAKGLDYGCGPVKGIAHLLNQEGIECDSYDPFFFPELKEKDYDFVFSSECFEHFFSPKDEIEKILLRIKPGGYLFVMTEIFHSIDRFSTWYYKRDLTHVSFFCMDTWSYIAEHYALKMMYSDAKRVFLFQLG